MARMKASERDYKKSQGKELFIKGFSQSNIAELIGVTERTVGKWVKDDEWEHAKRIATIKPSEIKNMILDYVVALQDGKTPQHKADDLAKISAAWDRLDDNRKKAVYSMETLDDFCSWMTTKAAKAKPKQREDIIDTLKSIRVLFDEYINELLTND